MSDFRIVLAFAALSATGSIAGGVVAEVFDVSDRALRIPGPVQRRRRDWHRQRDQSESWSALGRRAGHLAVFSHMFGSTARRSSSF